MPARNGKIYHRMSVLGNSFFTLSFPWFLKRKYTNGRKGIIYPLLKCTRTTHSLSPNGMRECHIKKEGGVAQSKC